MLFNSAFVVKSPLSLLPYILVYLTIGFSFQATKIFQTSQICCLQLYNFLVLLKTPIHHKLFQLRNNFRPMTFPND